MAWLEPGVLASISSLILEVTSVSFDGHEATLVHPDSGVSLTLMCSSLKPTIPRLFDMVLFLTGILSGLKGQIIHMDNNCAVLYVSPALPYNFEKFVTLIGEMKPIVFICPISYIDGCVPCIA